MTLTPKPSRPHMPGYGLLAPDEGQGLKPWSYAVDRLLRARGYWIATTRDDGRPHSVPIWGLWLRDHFLFSTGAQSRKTQNIAHNPYVVIGAEPSDDAIVLEGRAFKVDDPSWLREFADRYTAKYAMTMDDFDEPVYAVSPLIAFSFSTAPGDFEGGSTRWTFESPR